MNLRTILTACKPTLRNSRKPLARRTNPYCPLHVEALEDRRLLAVVPDTNWATAGGGAQDLNTGLVWSAQVPGSTSYSYAQSYISGLPGGDWRLPTLAELQEAMSHGLVNHGDYTPYAGYHFWTSTSGSSGNHWLVEPAGTAVQYSDVGYISAVGVRGTRDVLPHDTSNVRVFSEVMKTKEGDGSGLTPLFTLALDTRPTSNVTIGISSADPTEGTPLTNSLVFTPTNWNIPQYVKLASVDDSVYDPSKTYQIQFTATSGDVAYQGLPIHPISIWNINNDLPINLVPDPANNPAVTSESGTVVTLWASLDAPPQPGETVYVAPAQLRLDATEGRLFETPEEFAFTVANWNTPQRIQVQGVADGVFDGDQTHWAKSFVTHVEMAGDPDWVSDFAIRDPARGLWDYSASVSIVNRDIDIPPTKFYVVDDASTDRTYGYSASGGAIANNTLGSGNTAPRGAASTAAGTMVWVVDANKNVYRYDASGVLQGSWAAGGLPSNAQIEGIATNGTDIWLVDAKGAKVYYYYGAASRTLGSQSNSSSFALNSSDKNPKDIVTDGTYLWTVDDSSTDKVFKYTTSGTLVGSWTIGSANTAPTGITIDPSNVSDIWIVDSVADKVFQYTAAAGRTSGSQSPAASFALAAGNTNPQGIADPPPPAAASAVPALSVSTPAAVDVALGQLLMAEAASVGSQRVETLRCVALGSVLDDSELPLLESFTAPDVGPSLLRSVATAGVRGNEESSDRSTASDELFAQTGLADLLGKL